VAQIACRFGARKIKTCWVQPLCRGKRGIRMHQPGAKSEMPVEAVMRVNKRQMYLQSCGAATLLCAAMELGVRHLPNLPGSILSNGQPRNADGTCESAIHQITSGAATGGNARLMPNQNTGYSIPYSLALAAQLLGLDVRVHMLPGLISSSVSALYPNVESLCGGSGVPVDRGPLPRLADNLSPITHHGRVAPGASLHLGAPRRYFDGSRDRPNLSFHRQCLERAAVLRGRRLHRYRHQRGLNVGPCHRCDRIPPIYTRSPAPSSLRWFPRVAALVFCSPVGRDEPAR